MQIRTVEALITDTLLSGQLYLRLPSQFPVFLNSNTNSANCKLYISVSGQLQLWTPFYILRVSAQKSSHLANIFLVLTGLKSHSAAGMLWQIELNEFI